MGHSLILTTVLAMRLLIVLTIPQQVMPAIIILLTVLKYMLMLYHLIAGMEKILAHQVVATTLLILFPSLMVIPTVLKVGIVFLTLKLNHYLCLKT